MTHPERGEVGGALVGDLAKVVLVGDLAVGVISAAGLVLGLLLAFATGILVSSLLYEVSALDPVAFTVAPLVLVAAGLLATWLPARRATHISPMAALRTE